MFSMLTLGQSVTHQGDQALLDWLLRGNDYSTPRMSDNAMAKEWLIVDFSTHDCPEWLYTRRSV
jgi:hypothetical protein